MQEARKKTLLWKARSRIVVSVLDVLILRSVEKNGKIHGYGLLREVAEEYGVKPSSANVYNRLYKMAARGLLTASEGVSERFRQTRMEYALTERGRATLHVLLQNKLVMDVLKALLA